MEIRGNLGGFGIVAKPQGASITAQGQFNPLPAHLRVANAAKAAGICHYPGCNNGVFVDAKGNASPACKRSHMKLPANYSPTTQKTTHAAHTAGICHYPGCSSKVYVDANGNASPACKRSHMKLPANYSPTTQKTTHAAHTAGICQLPGCNKAVYVGASGPSNACGMTHKGLLNRMRLGYTGQ